MKNQSFVLNNIEKSIKDINRKVMQDNELTLEEKYKLMRDFVLQMNEQHRRKVNLDLSRMKKWRNSVNSRPDAFVSSLI
jgi:hypothetical protein